MPVAQYEPLAASPASASKLPLTSKFRERLPTKVSLPATETIDAVHGQTAVINVDRTVKASLLLNILSMPSAKDLLSRGLGQVIPNPLIDFKIRIAGDGSEEY